MKLLCLSIVIGSLAAHAWHPVCGQAVVQNDSRPRITDDRAAQHEAWSQRVILTSGDSFIGSLRGWNSNGAWTFDVVEKSGGESTKEPLENARTRTEAASDLVRFGTVPRPELASGVWLVDGSQLVGRIVELDADSCRLVSRWFDVSIPLERIRSLLLNAPVSDHLRQQQLRAAELASGADDVILLIDGGRREGTLRLSERSLSPLHPKSTVELKTAGDEVEAIPMQRIRSIILSPILRDEVGRQAGAGQGSGRAENAPPSRMRLGLLDGSILNVERAALTKQAGTAPLVLESGVALTSRRQSQRLELPQIITMLAPLPLPASCLAAQPPLRYRHLPFFGEAVPLVRWNGEQIGPLLAGGRYPNGLWMRTAARAVYPAKGASRLAGAVTVAEPGWDTVPGLQMQMNLGVRFSVQASGPDGQLNSLWNSGVVRPGQPPIPFELDISGAALIVLAVDPVDSGDFGDRAVWLDLVAASIEAP